MKRFEIYFRLIRIPVDFALAYGALYVSYLVRKTELISKYLAPVDLSYLNASKDYLELSLLLAGMLVVIFFFVKLYSLKSIDTYAAQVKKITLASIFWLMAIITYYFLVRDFPFSRSVILANVLVVIVFVSFGRFLIHSLQNSFLRRGVGVRKVLLIGGNKELLEKIYLALDRDFHYKVVGYISEKQIKSDILSYKLRWGGFDKLEGFFRRRKFDDVIHIGRQGSDNQNLELINLCRVYHKDYQYMPDVFEVQRKNVLLSSIDGIPVFRVQPTSLDGWGRVLKRLFDLIVSGILLIFLIPVFLVTAFLIAVDSPGGVFFRRDDEGKIVLRAGYKGEPFHCWKFRTMKAKTHGMRSKELASKDLRGNDPLVKIKDDPRVTKFGRFLRRFDIDELPQLWNVFIGQMSLVGPRPHLLEEVEKYQEHHRFVFTVKPGITGLAQVSGRSDLGFDEEVRLDTYYIENWNLWLDIKILLKTVSVVLGGHGEFGN